MTGCCRRAVFQVTWGPRGKGGILSGNVYGRTWHKALSDGRQPPEHHPGTRRA
jgi:hypothetical protein